MLLDRIILFLIWLITLTGIIYLTPRERMREAHVVFFFKQCMTWILGLIVVETRLIEYPIKLFPNATSTSFTFEYFVYPAICVVFVIRFPEQKKILHKIGWYLFFPTWITVIEVLIEQNTNLIRYIHWSWFWSWLSLLVTFFISRVYYLWFFRKF